MKLRRERKKERQKRAALKQLNRYKLRINRLADLRMESMGYPETTELSVVRHFVKTSQLFAPAQLFLDEKTGYITLFFLQAHQGYNNG